MINEALRLIRVFHDMKQYELAERLKVSKSHISEIENGNKTPSLELIEKYSVEFRIPVSAIMFFAEEIPNAKRGRRHAQKLLQLFSICLASSRGKRMPQRIALYPTHSATAHSFV